jgi:dihydrofolate reductase
MRKIHVFENVTLDGRFTDENKDMSWAHRQDEEWNEFTSSNASGDAELLFGRVTYDMMAGFWPTQQAAAMMPAVAAGMNRMRKSVFSRTLDAPTWHNTRVLKGDLVETTRALKREPGPDLVVLGSGSIVSQLTEARLVDEYQLAVNPLVLGRGRTLFETVSGKVPLRLTRTRAFKNGNVVLWYELA